MKEVVQRYFEIPEVIAPIPSWVDGEYHSLFSYNNIIQFASPEYWYLPAEDVPILRGKRPNTLQIALFVGTNQVVIDSNTMVFISEAQSLGARLKETMAVLDLLVACGSPVPFGGK